MTKIWNYSIHLFRAKQLSSWRTLINYIKGWGSYNFFNFFNFITVCHNYMLRTSKFKRMQEQDVFVYFRTRQFQRWPNSNKLNRFNRTMLRCKHLQKLFANTPTTNYLKHFISEDVNHTINSVYKLWRKLCTLHVLSGGLSISVQATNVK